MKPVPSPKKAVFAAICLAAVCGLIFCFAGVDQTRRENGFAQPDDFFISTQKMLADYGFMWAALEDQFPFFDEASQNGFFESRNIDKSEIRDKYRRMITEVTSSQDKDPYEKPDTSVPVLYPNLYSDSKNAMNTIFALAIDSFQNLGHLRTLTIEYYKAETDTAEPFPDKTHAFYQLLAENSPDEQTDTHYDPDDYFYLEYADGVPKITITSFESGGSDENLQKAIKTVSGICDKAMESDDIIIDIRGNGGGNSYIWQKGLARLFYDRQKPFVSLGGFKAGCLDYFGEHASQNGCTLYPVNPQDPSLLYPDERVNETMRRAGLDYIIETTVNGIIPKPEGSSYDGDIWLLVDGQCASSSEMLALFCKNTGAATIVGTKTRGLSSIGFSPIFKSLYLPESGLCIQFEWIAYLNPDLTFNNFTGTAPDIETESDALEVCLEQIRKEA